MSIDSTSSQSSSSSSSNVQSSSSDQTLRRQDKKPTLFEIEQRLGDDLPEESRQLLHEAMRSMTKPKIPLPKREAKSGREESQGGSRKFWDEVLTKIEERGGSPLELGSGKELGKGVLASLLKDSPLLPPDAAKKGALKEKSHQRTSERKGEEKQATASTTAAQQQSAEAARQAGPGAVELGGLDTGGVTQSGESTLSSQIDKIIRIFQTTQPYGAQLNSVRLSALDASQTRISLSMSNGIQVDVDLAAGGRDLNITVRGISAELQSELDTPEQHERLRQLLQGKGFNVHQITTERGDESRMHENPMFEPQPSPEQADHRRIGDEGESPSQGRKQGEEEEESS